MKVEMTLEVLNGIKNGHEQAMQSCKSAEDKLLVSITEQAEVITIFIAKKPKSCFLKQSNLTKWQKRLKS